MLINPGLSKWLITMNVKGAIGADLFVEKTELALPDKCKGIFFTINEIDRSIIETRRT